MNKLAGRAFRALKASAALAACLAVLGAGILAVSPQARAEVFRALPVYWGDANGAIWGMLENGQLLPMRSTTINSTNTTVTGSSSTELYYLTNMSGNHTFTLPTVTSVGARAHYRIIAAGNNIGTTGNLAISAASSGNVNTIDTLTVTNTSGASGAVQVIDCYADQTAGTNDWFVTVGRR